MASNARLLCNKVIFVATTIYLERPLMNEPATMSLYYQHILLAEDDEDDQELLKEAFSKADPSCKLHIEDNGRNALQYLEQLSDNALPRIIILDYNMPELNGGQVLEKLY